MTNIAEMENQGVELGLSIVAVDQDRFDWNIGFNAAYNVNEITQLNNAAAEGETPAPIPVGGISGDVGQTIQVYNVGSPIFAYRTYEQIYEGGQPVYSDRLIEMYVDQNNDGIINENDLIISEQPAPIVSLGFTSNATYGNFSLILRSGGTSETMYITILLQPMDSISESMKGVG